MRKEEKALVVKKENPFLKLPGIKQIYEYMQKKKQEKVPTKRFSGDMHINMSDIPAIQIESHVKETNLELKSNNQANSENIKIQLKKENFKSQQPIKTETIVVSDLHGQMHKWEFVKTELNNNPLLKVIILGDAMDRGEYGPEILLEIKELSDRGRVQYLPGNHDMFAYNYLRSKGINDTICKNSLLNLERKWGKINKTKIR